MSFTSTLALLLVGATVALFCWPSLDSILETLFCSTLLS